MSTQPVGRLEVRLGLDWRQFKAGLTGARGEVNTFSRAVSAGLAPLRNLLGLAGIGLSAGALVRGLRSAVSELSDLGKTARDTGLDVEELQGLMRGFERNTRVSSETLATALVDFNGRVGEAVNGQGALLAVSERYGIALRGANGQVRHQADLLREVAQVIRAARTEQERLAIAQAAFGEPGRLMAQALAQGAAGIDEMIDQARAAGDVIDRNLILRAEILDDKFDALTRRVRTFFQALAVGALAGGAATATDTLVALFGTLERARAVLGDGVFETLIAETRELAALDGVTEALDGLVFSVEELVRSGRWAEGELAGLVFTLGEMGKTAAADEIRALYEELLVLSSGLTDGTVSARQFDRRLSEIAAESVRVLQSLGDVDAARFSRVISALGNMNTLLAAARVQAQALRAELPGGIEPGAISRLQTRFGVAAETFQAMQRFAVIETDRASRTREQISLEAELESVMRRARDAGVTLTQAQAEAQARLNLQLAAAANPARTREGGVRAERPDDFARAVTSIREQTAALEMETAAMLAAAAAGEDYAAAIEYARQRAELMNAAQRVGIEITSQLQTEIDALARAYTRVGEEAATAAANIQQAEEDSRRGAEALSGLFAGILQGGEAGRRALIGLIEQLSLLAIQRQVMGLGQGGGLFGNLFGMLGRALRPAFQAGGYTGNGGADQVAGVVHGGEFVFSAPAVNRMGAGALDAMHRAAVKGYAGGGLVGAMAPAAAGADRGFMATSTRGAGDTHVHFHGVRDVAGFRQSQTQISADLARVVAMSRRAQ